jgi:hypothetical protein
MDITTIKITKKTKERLENLRIYRRESYEEIMEKIFGVLNLCRADPEQAKLKLMQINRERKRNLGAGGKEVLSEEDEYQESLSSQKERFHLRK